LVDQAQQRCGALCQAVWTQLGSKRRRWERRRARWYDYAFASRRQLCEALLDGCKQSSPIVMLEASSSAPSLLRLYALAPEGLLSLEGPRPLGRDKAACTTRACQVKS
jgi:hypothetical protein